VNSTIHFSRRVADDHYLSVDLRADSQAERKMAVKLAVLASAAIDLAKVDADVYIQPVDGYDDTYTLLSVLFENPVAEDFHLDLVKSVRLALERDSFQVEVLDHTDSVPLELEEVAI